MKVFMFSAQNTWYLVVLSWEKSAGAQEMKCLTFPDVTIVKKNRVVIMSDKGNKTKSHFLNIKSQGCLLISGKCRAENTTATKDIMKAIKLPAKMTLGPMQFYFESFLRANDQRNLRKSLNHSPKHWFLNFPKACFFFFLSFFLTI